MVPLGFNLPKSATQAAWVNTWSPLGFEFSRRAPQAGIPLRGAKLISNPPSRPHRVVNPWCLCLGEFPLITRNRSHWDWQSVFFRLNSYSPPPPTCSHAIAIIVSNSTLIQAGWLNVWWMSHWMSHFCEIRHLVMVSLGSVLLWN